jgi:glycosyltransferase involved in cell wall biosynthesis
MAASFATPQTRHSVVPLVSVWLITYNHEPYIAQAIEGVLMQQTTFLVELIIGEDFSTDRTRAIVQEFKNKYPDRIKLFLSPQNLGMVPILRPTYAMCAGKYVAMLDGDDYWTDPYKLQKQIDLMEADNTCLISFHKVLVYNEDNQDYTQPDDTTWTSVSHTLSLHDLIYLGNPIYTVSAIFRRPTWDLPSYYYLLPYPDLAIYYILLAAGGKAVYMPQTMGVYRIHNKGSYTGMNWYQKRKNSFLFFDIIQQHLPERYYQQIEAERQFILYDLLVAALKHKQLKEALRYFQLLDWPNNPVPQTLHSRIHYFSFSTLRLLARMKPPRN